MLAAGVLLTAIGSLIAGRLFFIQVISHKYYETLAERQHTASLSVNTRRGNIYFSELDGGLFTVAHTKSGFLAYIDPRKIEDPESLYAALSDIIQGLERKNFLKLASKKDDPFEIIAHRLEADSAEKIAALNHSGVGVLGEEWRFYPAGVLAANVIGFAGYKGDDIVGRYGIEYSQEEMLSGKKNVFEGRRTVAGIFLDWGKKIFPDIHPAYDVVLTIEPQAQLFLEEELQRAVDKWRPSLAGGIIMDPETGRILAMASRPAFDPNKYGEVKSLDVFVNPNLEHIYELGSVFKPLTLAAALDLQKITPETTYFDRGFVEVGGKKIENYDGKGRGLADMQRVLNESLNTGAVFVMRQIGPENLKKYFERLGLYEKTGILLPGEVSGDLSNLKSGREIEYATAAFGQGVAVTPLAFLRAVSALANGGKLVKPLIIKRVLVDGAPDIIFEPEVEEDVISPQTSDEITRMLVRVVDEALLGGTVRNGRYSIAAKTGTAELPNPGGRGYSGEYLHSFFGYGPAYDARFAIFLFLVKPQEVRYASQSLAEPFMNIMKFLLNYYNVPPDK